VVIHDLNHVYRLDRTPIQSPVILRGCRTLRGLNDQTLAVWKPQGKLTLSIAVQLMASARQMSKIIKASRRPQIGKPSGDFLGAPITVLLLERSKLFTGLLQFSLCKRDLQGRSFRFLSTSLV
jgi:hypothetical protein